MKMMSHLDLLDEPLITVRQNRDEERSMSLPEVLERLSHTEDLNFQALRAHQQHPWYAFLVQLAVVALHHSGEEFRPADARQWQEYLFRLVGESREAFCLVAEDFSKPAFFQPPIVEGSLATFKKQLTTPDELDMLVTAKNHDLKASKMVSPRPEHWMFSLMTLQTMEGFLGAGNYGVVRMNGGFASRPFVSCAPSLGWGARFCRDVKLLISEREVLVESHGFRESGGKTLLWLDPWDGSTSLELHECDPFFIEICRRVRLTMKEDRLLAVGQSTSAARIAQRDRKGNTGDPWTPVERSDAPKALNVTSSGFGYDLTQRLICSGEFKVGLTQRFYKEDPDKMWFVANALASNTTDLTSGLFYSYVVVDVPHFVSNLEGCRHEDAGDADRELAAGVVKSIIHLMATVSPGAKLGSTAPYACASFAMVECGKSQPRTLANAFLKPVDLRPRSDLLSDTYKALAGFMKDEDAMYGARFKKNLAGMGSLASILDVLEMEKPSSLKELAEWAADNVRRG